MLNHLYLTDRDEDCLRIGQEPKAGDYERITWADRADGAPKSGGVNMELLTVAVR